MPQQHSKTAAACFLLLIPGYFAYHVMAGQGLIPLVLGGYTTQMSLPMLPFLALAYASRQSRPRPQLDLVFFAFVAYFLAVVLLHLLFGTNDEVARTHLSVVLQFLALFFIARLADPLDPRFRARIRLVLLVLSGVIFAFSPAGSFQIGIFNAEDAERQLATYQGYAMVYALLLIYAAATTRKRISRLGFYLAGLPGVFLIASRSELLGMVLAVPLIEFSYSRNRTFFVVLAAGGAVAGAGTVSAALTYLPRYNRFRSLLDISGDYSLSMRLQTIADGLRTIQRHPLLGDYGSYEPGAWPHNLLSAWVDLGLIGFVLLSALLTAPLLRYVAEFRGAGREPLFVLCLTVMSFTLLLSLTSKAFHYQMIPIAVGLAARRRMLALAGGHGAAGDPPEPARAAPTPRPTGASARPPDRSPPPGRRAGAETATGG